MSPQHRTDTQGPRTASLDKRSGGLGSCGLDGFGHQHNPGNSNLLPLHCTGEGKAENPAEVFDKGKLASKGIGYAARIDKAVRHFRFSPLDSSKGKACASVDVYATAHNLNNESKQRLDGGYPPEFIRNGIFTTPSFCEAESGSVIL